jgi:hypothetical protein
MHGILAEDFRPCYEAMAQVLIVFFALILAISAVVQSVRNHRQSALGLLLPSCVLILLLAVWVWTENKSMPASRRGPDVGFSYFTFFLITVIGPLLAVNLTAVVLLISKSERLSGTAKKTIIAGICLLSLLILYMLLFLKIR